jgi:DNA invertase Pin-like site-specific DNA recombinase
MPKRKPRGVTVSTPQKGRSKLNSGIPLDEPLAAHASGRRSVRATKKTPTRAPAAAKPPKTKPKKALGRRLPRRDDAQVIQDGPPRLVGYARISTDDQTTALQADALMRAAVDVVVQEEASGKNTARPVLAKTLATLRSGDTLVIWRLDRLGRSLAHLIEVATVLRERGVFLRSFTEGFDTSTASGRLLYHVLGAVAEFEREVIKERTVAGMKAAKKRGTHVGRPKALAGSRLAEAGRMLAAGKSQIETARILRVSRATIQRAYPGRTHVQLLASAEARHGDRRRL